MDAFRTRKDQVIFELDEVRTRSGEPFSVFTPYKNAWLAKLDPFARLRLLDLDHHVRPGEHLGGGPGDSRAGGTVGVVVRSDAGAGAGLDQNVMAVRRIFAHRARRQANAIFVVLDFPGAADAHLVISSAFAARCSLSMRD